MAELEDAAAAAPAPAPAAATNQTRAQTPPPTPPPNQSEDERPTPPPTPPQPSTPEAPIKPPEDWRVKVYRLNDEGQWDDRGTGRVSLQGARVLVVSEGDRSEVLLASAPRGPNPVSRQGENILTWDACRGDDGSALADDQPSLRRGETACVALSFQEARGCDAVLGKLRAAIAIRPSSPPRDDPGPPGADPSSLEPRPSIVAEDEGATHARAFLAHVLGARGAGVASALETAAQRAPPHPG